MPWFLCFPAAAESETGETDAEESEGDGFRNGKGIKIPYREPPPTLSVYVESSALSAIAATFGPESLKNVAPLRQARGRTN